MQITFYSIMMALIWVSIIIVGMYFLRRNIYTIPYFNVRLLLFMYSLCIIRICFPFEFSFTKVVDAPLLYNWMFPFFMEDLSFFNISPWKLIIIIFSTVSAFKLFKLLNEYYYINKIIHSIYHYQDDEIIKNIKEEFTEFDSLKYVIVNSIFQSPMQIGFIHPTILLPTIDYDAKDLYYILKHEMTHYYNRDTWIKLGINLWRCLFWWFPLTYLLYHELDESLELKCDYMVLKDMTTCQRNDYLTALIHVYEHQNVSNKNNKIFARKATALYKDSDSLIHRFKYITTKKKDCSIMIPIWITFLVLFLVSYSFIFQASEEPAYENDGSIYFSQDNACIYYNMESEYELYINNEFATKLDEENATKLINEGIICLEKR